MNVIYQSQFTYVGDSAREGFDDGVFITFAENEATDDMKEYCFLHRHGMLTQDFSLGDLFVIGGKRFPITAIGNNALDNFRALGHVTIYFDGEEKAKLPGTVHLLGHLPSDALVIGSDFTIESY
ncbi:MAG: PTS glucitol/sorbitol transporter subunit IIA [Cardiobacteriaceae bacterium]|nr:PTS glucitol/sorbitol transporter subunit IIA [Cardiobacteriaceae bacterium]